LKWPESSINEELSNFYSISNYFIVKKKDLGHFFVDFKRDGSVGDTIKYSHRFQPHEFFRIDGDEPILFKICAKFASTGHP